MGMNRGEGGIEGSLVELKEEDESCRHTLKKKKFRIQVVCTEKLKHYIVL